ncbi:MAG: ATP-binding cassette domain-containing protein, partial [Bacillota bacterium]
MTAMLKLENVCQYFGTDKKPIKAVDSVSLELEVGKVLCLVGESGCGKTTTGKMAAGILQPTAGRVVFEGKDPWHLSAEEAMKYRLAVQYVHQDPYTSLNPSRTIGDA